MEKRNATGTGTSFVSFLIATIIALAGISAFSGHRPSDAHAAESRPVANPAASGEKEAKAAAVGVLHVPTWLDLDEALIESMYAATVPEPSGSSAAKEPAAADDWRLILVNRGNAVPEGFSVQLAPLDGEQALDERCLADLVSMLDDCRAAGNAPVVCSSYRTQEMQERLFADQVMMLVDEGLPEDAAVEEASHTVAFPGTSEHQIGLAVDIVDEAFPVLTTEQEDTSTQQWLMQNSWRYGFILRYPADKCDATGITYEPWHYRYVGRDAALDIYQGGMCLEEYLTMAGR